MAGLRTHSSPGALHRLLPARRCPCWSAKSTAMGGVLQAPPAAATSPWGRRLLVLSVTLALLIGPSLLIALRGAPGGAGGRVVVGRL